MCVSVSYGFQIKPGCSITDCQGSIRSLTAFFFDRFALMARSFARRQSAFGRSSSVW